MDKNLHNDIGQQFSEGINSLSQQPREHIWQNIDKTLDKADAENYKGKFARLKKRSTLLLLLLLGMSTASVIYFSNTKSNNDGLATEKTGTVTDSKETANQNIHVQQAPVAGNVPQQQPGSSSAADGSPAVNAGNVFWALKKTGITQKGKAVIAINGGAAAAAETTDNTSSTTTAEPDTVTAATALALTLPVITAAPVAAVPKKDLPAAAENKSAEKSSPENSRKKDARFSLTAFFAPDYSNYHLTNDRHSNYDNGAGIASRERSDLSSTAGVLLGYKAGKRITLQSGLTYSSSNISIDPTKIYAEKNTGGAVKYRYNTSSGYGYLLPSFSSSPAVGDSLFASGANHTLHYISIPVMVKYAMGKGKLTFHPGAGIGFNFLTKATLTTDVQDRFNSETEYITRLEGLKKVSCSLLLVPELQYKLSQKISISAMPYFKYALGPINKGNVVKSYPYTVGLGLGLVYRF
jgi:hypothetical protein